MLKNLLLCMSLLACSACSKPDSEKGCAAQVCTLEFRSVTVRLVDKDGQPVNAANFQAVNLRTGKPISGKVAVDNAAPGYYVVVNDSSVKDLAESGDDIRVTATKSGAQQAVSAIYRVSGGECACHINKISGPEQMAFNE